MNNSDKKLIFAGDGQYDSPGYCAMNHAYSIIDTSTKLCVSLQVMERKETGMVFLSYSYSCYLFHWYKLSVCILIAISIVTITIITEVRSKILYKLIAYLFLS